jgi:hypothetical protein
MPPTAPAPPGFSRYLLSRAVSVAGTLVAAVAVPVLVYRMTGSPAWTSAAAATGALPYLFFGLVAGALADRLDRRRVMVACDLLTAAALASVPLAWWAGVLTPWHVVAASFAVQALFVFFDAANFGALPVLVGRDRLAEGYARVYGATTAVELLVPPLAGLAVAVVAPAPLISLNVLTALASAALLRSITVPLSAPRSGAPARGARALAGEVREGLAFLWSEPTVRTLTLVGATHSAASGAWLAMLVPWADRSLGVAPSGDPRLAVLFSCWGVGALGASALAPRLARRLGAARLALVALPVSLGCGLAVVASGHWWAGAAGAALWGGAYSVVVINAITFRQRVSPDHLQSRVSTTARMLSWGVGQPVGAALAGAVAVTAWGPRGGLAAGLAVLALGAALAWLSPLRRQAFGGGPPAPAEPSEEAGRPAAD